MLEHLNSKVIECLMDAEECTENAAKAATPEQRAFYIRMEQRYLSLAKSWEFFGRLRQLPRK